LRNASSSGQRAAMVCKICRGVAFPLVLKKQSSRRRPEGSRTMTIDNKRGPAEVYHSAWRVLY